MMEAQTQKRTTKWEDVSEAVPIYNLCESGPMDPTVVNRF